jgi:hypothetical protein
MGTTASRHGTANIASLRKIIDIVGNHHVGIKRVSALPAIAGHVISFVTDRRWSRCLHPRANGSRDQCPADSSYYPDCNCGTLRQNPFAVEIAQTATHRQMKRRSHRAPALLKSRSRVMADKNHS